MPKENGPDVIVSLHGGGMTLEKCGKGIKVDLKDYDISHIDEDREDIREDDGGRYILL